MTTSMQFAVRDTLELLQTLQAEKIQPKEARALVYELRKRYTDLKLDLLSEVEEFDHSLHYDALLREPGFGTVSISYCQEKAVPWPMRGVHRWSDADLVRVNTKVITVDQVIALLDFIWDEATITDRIINQALMQQELERSEYNVSDEELQHEVDTFRKSRHLHNAAETEKWLADHGLSHEKLESYLTDSILFLKLKEQAVEGKVEDYFFEHFDELEQIQVAQIVVDNEETARWLSGRIKRGELEFYAVAESQSLETMAAASKPAPLFVNLKSGDLDQVDRNELRSAAVGQIVGPIRTSDGTVVVKLLGRNEAQLDEATRNEITETLFDQWLAVQRSMVRVEWCWGNISKTG